MNILDRFLKYVSFDTQSQDESSTFPSTMKQHELADYLVSELKNLGIKNAYKDEFSYVYAKIPGKINKSIGLIRTKPILAEKWVTSQQFYRLGKLWN